VVIVQVEDSGKPMLFCYAKFTMALIIVHQNLSSYDVTVGSELLVLYSS
jgi:hypothetical protein